MIPINILNEHWALIIVDKLNQTMWYYDSLGSYKDWDGVQFLDVVLSFMRHFDQMCMGSANKEDFDIDEWTLMSSKDIYKRSPTSAKEWVFTNVPQQNGYDCGIFVLKYVELYMTYPDHRDNLSGLMKKHPPDRNYYKKRFMGLYVFYRGKQPKPPPVTEPLSADGNGKKQPKKRVKEEEWGAEYNYKRTRNDRDKTDISLRESTKHLSMINVTTPIKGSNSVSQIFADNGQQSPAQPLGDNADTEMEKLCSPISNILSEADDALIHTPIEADDDDIPVEDLFRHPRHTDHARIQKDINDTDDVSDMTQESCKTTKPRLSSDVSQAKSQVKAPEANRTKSLGDQTKVSQSSFDSLIADYEIATKNLQNIFSAQLQDLLYDPNESTFEEDLLKLHYKHEDFRTFVHKHIEDELLKYKKLLKKENYSNEFDRTKFQFDTCGGGIRQRIKKILNHFPHDRDERRFPVTSYTDVIRDMPEENTTIMDIIPQLSNESSHNKRSNVDVVTSPAEEKPILTITEDTTMTTLPSENVIPATTEQEDLEVEWDIIVPAATTHIDIKNIDLESLKAESDEISYIGVQLRAYKKKLISTEKNKRLHEQVILSHESTLCSDSSEKTSFRLKGFQNFGNTCYINSVLQCLFRVSYIQKILNEYRRDGKAVPNLIARLQDVYLAVNRGSTKKELNQSLRSMITVSVL